MSNWILHYRPLRGRPFRMTGDGSSRVASRHMSNWILHYRPLRGRPFRMTGDGSIRFSNYPHLCSTYHTDYPPVFQKSLLMLNSGFRILVSSFRTLPLPPNPLPSLLPILKKHANPRICQRVLIQLLHHLRWNCRHISAQLG